MPTIRHDARIQPPEPATKLLYRSGAVARMVRMPVSTLRIWERRYQAVAPTTSPAGHRLYTAADVERVAVLRQLTENGHAIGSIAALPMAQLRDVVQTHAAGGAKPGGESARPSRAAGPRWVVVGAALARRLLRPTARRSGEQAPQVVAVFETLAEAVPAASGLTADRLVWQTPGLKVGDLPELLAAQAACGAGAVGVVYAFAGTVARKAFAGAGVQLALEPRDDEALGAWLSGLVGPMSPRSSPARPPATPIDALWPGAGVIAPRRFDDATLTDLAGLPSAMACECPRHVAELLMQLSSFEVYSADCENLSPADAELHGYLHRVAATARTLFESALERVAMHENLSVR